MEMKCGMELFSGDKIINKCAPAYFPYDPNNSADPDCVYDFKCSKYSELIAYIKNLVKWITICHCFLDDENDILIKGTNTDEISSKYCNTMFFEFILYKIFL